MKKLIFYLLIALAFSGCKHRVVRIDYDLKKSDYGQCFISIKRDFTPSDSIAFKVGEILLGETGFSVACSEKRAIKLLQDEGCALGADLINITKEKRPDGWSSCYRCTAEFYKFKDSSIQIASDPTYQNNNVDQRVSKDRKRTGGLILGTVVVAAAIVLLISIL